MPTRTGLDGESAVSLYVIAGIATSPDFMEELRDELVRRFRAETGSERIRSALLHPYGAWDRSIWAQLRDIRRDMRLAVGKRSGSRGGAHVLERLAADGALRGTLWLVGHSGGGVAAVHAAEALLALPDAPDCRIVQVGSPRCAVPEPLRGRTAYLYAVGRDGRAKDPICRLGSWGGWERAGAELRAGKSAGRRVPQWPPKLGVPRWNRDKQAPHRRVPLPIVGGHADYFRSGGMFRQALDGRSNMELTVEAMWPTLRGDLRSLDGESVEN
ncbi:hypothetical protein [Gordoniibacillus kamchatkensis]|uniref:hypothetical protein n=1 Tax=Gordoniibacillus kamchatkensis TaxID=1590651 RepID=UPI000696DFC0|nr:hypothetical protein [Paenibacillus sp. VKM B-2647]